MFTPYLYNGSIHVPLNINTKSIIILQPKHTTALKFHPNLLYVVYSIILIIKLFILICYNVLDRL